MIEDKYYESSEDITVLPCRYLLIVPGLWIFVFVIATIQRVFRVLKKPIEKKDRKMRFLYWYV